MKRLLLVLLFVAPLIVLPAANSQERTVTEVKAIAKPKQYHGPCPTTIEFVATIFVSHHPARVDYQWERSDGAKGPRQTITNRSAGEGVSTTWEISRRIHGEFDGWEKLHVLAPTGISSNEAQFQIKCD